MPSKKNPLLIFGYKTPLLIFSYKTRQEDGSHLIFQIVNEDATHENRTSVFTLYNFAEIEDRHVGVLTRFAFPAKEYPSVISGQPLHCYLHDTLDVFASGDKHRVHYHIHLDKPVDLALFQQIVANLIQGTETLSFLRQNDLIKRYLSADVQAPLAHQYQGFLDREVPFSFSKPMDHYPIGWYFHECPGQKILLEGRRTDPVPAADRVAQETPAPQPSETNAAYTHARRSAPHPMASNVGLAVVLGIVLLSILSHYMYKARKRANPPPPAQAASHPHAS